MIYQVALSLDAVKIVLVNLQIKLEVISSFSFFYFNYIVEIYKKVTIFGHVCFQLSNFMSASFNDQSRAMIISLREPLLITLLVISTSFTGMRYLRKIFIVE